VGQKHTAGGVSVWLCGNPSATPPVNPPSGTPGCGATSDRIRGTLAAANVVGPTPQLVGPGELEDLLEAIRRGAAYVNVHSTKVLSGEIRGQIKGDDD